MKLQFHGQRLINLRSISLAGMIIALLSVSCSYLRPQKRLDLTPFAENMVSLVGDVQYTINQSQAVYIRDYLDGPKVQELMLFGNKTRTLLRAAIAYAVQLVTLTQANMTDQERAVELADYLDDLLRPVFQAPASRLELTETDLDTVLRNVRQQQKFIDALSKAQPVINEIARAAGEFFDDTQGALEQAVGEINQRINDNNRMIVEADKKLRANQIGSINGIQYLRSFREGDLSAMDTLFAREPSLKDQWKSPREVTVKDLRAIEDRLIFKMNALYNLRQQLIPDLELFWKQQKEVDELQKTLMSTLRMARVTIIVWSRAHQRLAAGVTDPAKIDVVRLARKAAGTALPIP
jgi:hypothetical protein